MSGFTDFPGSGPIRITTSEDLERAIVARTPSPQPRLRAITASAKRLNRDSVSYQRMSQPWQLRALGYYDVLGEIRFASQFYAKLLSKVRYYPARLTDDGGTEPILDGPPVELLNRIQDPGGGRSRLQYDYGRMMFVTGEGVLFGDKLETDEERWRFLWKDEVKIHDDGAAERVSSGKQSYDPPEYGVAYRLWTPHPRHSDEPDSPLHAIMDIAEELLILTASVRGTATTRMTNGIMAIPTELSPNPYGPPDTSTSMDGNYSGDEDPESNPFLDDYIQHVSGQIENPGSAEAKVPFLLEGAYDYIDRVRWIPTHDPQTDYMERELRKEAVQRLAIGMDFPPEFLLGMTDANHWTARQVVYDMWRSYGSPVAERFADDLNDSYLRKALEEENYEGWQDVVVAFDDSMVVISPDRTEDADKALDRIAIGFKGYRVLKGIPEDMAPTEEEKEFLASLKIRQEVEIEDGELVIPQRGPVANPDFNGSPENGPPSPGNRDGSRQEAQTASARIHGAAELALMRCRELAGIRIRHKCKDCAEGVADSLVASVLGPDKIPSSDPFGPGDPMKLVKGGADGFHSWLTEQSFDGSQASSLCQQLEVYAARTLFEPRCPQLPSGFVSAVEKAKETSDALTH